MLYFMWLGMAIILIAILIVNLFVDIEEKHILTWVLIGVAWTLANFGQISKQNDKLDLLLKNQAEIQLPSKDK